MRYQHRVRYMLPHDFLFRAGVKDMLAFFTNLCKMLFLSLPRGQLTRMARRGVNFAIAS
jgi:hypothetical protein